MAPFSMRNVRLQIKFNGYTVLFTVLFYTALAAGTIVCFNTVKSLA